MKLQYFGHSMWKITTDSLALVIDPFDDIGYPMPEGLTADVIIISHEHHDHNNVSLVRDYLKVIRQTGMYQVSDVQVELIPVYHDEERGAKRGRNHLILIHADGLNVLHCGDLGHIPDGKILNHIGKPDILMVPVGEVYTLPLTQVCGLIGTLSPTLTFPMHYSTPAIGFKLGELKAFLGLVPEQSEWQEGILDIHPELLSDKKVIIMKPPLQEVK